MGHLPALVSLLNRTWVAERSFGAGGRDTAHKKRLMFQSDFCRDASPLPVAHALHGAGAAEAQPLGNAQWPAKAVYEFGIGHRHIKHHV